MVDLRAAENIERIGMSVEMQDPRRSVLRQRAKDGERYGVIAADGDRHDLEIPQSLEKTLDRPHRLLETEGIDRRVTEVGDIADLERGDAARRMKPANEARGFA